MSNNCIFKSLTLKTKNIVITIQLKRTIILLLLITKTFFGNVTLHFLANLYPTE